MKYLILLVALATVAFAQNQRDFRIDPYKILRQESDQKEDGSNSDLFETENKIYRDEQRYWKLVGNDLVLVSQGQYQYISPDGKVISLKYVADENGFQPTGDHLPTPPPIPEEILRSLEFNANSQKQNN